MIILIGPSASGKTEIAKILISKHNFKKFITTTTRTPRLNEVNDVDYHFVSNNDFLCAIKNNKFIEFVNYNNNYYGTSIEEIDDNKVLIIEPKGLNAFNQLNNKSIISFYIDASFHTRKNRMISRGDNLDDINSRLKNDDQYFEGAKKEANYIINNDNDQISIDEIANHIYELYLKTLDKKI